MAKTNHTPVKVRRGQAMIETVFALIILTAVFLMLFQLAQMAQARIILDHAAARAARARAVGFNDFMCRKSARVAMIPVAGECVWPNPIPSGMSLASFMPAYLSSGHEGEARGILEFERWETTSIGVTSGDGLGASAEADLLMECDCEEPFGFRMDGHAEVESHYPLYMFNQGR